MGSLLFLLGGGVLLVVEYPVPGWVLVTVAFLLSANGLSIWAWDRLRAYVRPPDGENPGPDRTLTANPFSTESLVEMKVGAVMTLAFAGFLLLGVVALQFLGVRVVAVLCAVGLGVGNTGVVVRAYYRSG